MRQRYALLATSLAVATAACDSDTGRVMVAPNVKPVARIEAPAEATRGDLVRFDGRGSADPDGIIVSYAWSFGDGSAPSSLAEATHTYNETGAFVVRLTVTDNRGDTGTATAAITITNARSNLPPVAVIDAPASVDPGVPVLLDGSRSSDPDGSVVRWEWNLGDNLTAQGVQVSHTFTTPGRREISLAVTDDAGARSTATHTIEVGSAPANRAPIADAGPDRRVSVGVAFELDGSSSFDPDGQIAGFDWDLGDGRRANTARVTHTYNVLGEFLVTLTVTDDGGLTGTDTATITVVQESYDGNFSMVANPNSQACSIAPATFAATTIRFTSNGTSLTTETPHPEPGQPPIVMTGSLTGPTFTVSGSFSDSQGAQHMASLSGSFVSANRYMSTMQQSITFSGIPLCTLNWNISGDRLQ